MNEFQSQDFLDLALLDRIKADSDVAQATLAKALHVSIGTINGHLRQMVQNGFIVVKKGQRRKLSYIITTEGLALQRALTETFLQQGFQLYRQVRRQVQDLLGELESSGVKAVRLVGAGDVADICRLTCLENQVRLTDDSDAPALVVDGLEVSIEWL